MKKALIILVVLLLMGCKDNNMPLTYNNTIETSASETMVLEERSGLWFKGELSGYQIHLQYNVVGDRAIGKYTFEEEEHMLLRGYLDGESVMMKDDFGNEFIFYEEADQLYGVYLMSGEPEIFYAKKEQETFKKPGLSNDSMKLSGVYTGLNGTFYNQSSLKIKALFDHLIYVELNANNGASIGHHHFIAKKMGDKLLALTSDVQINLIITDQHEVLLEMSDQTYNCDSGVRYDDQYSESYKIESPSAIALGIVKTPSEIEFLKLLLETDYILLIENAQEVKSYREDGYQVTELGLIGQPDSIRILKKNQFYYVALKAWLYEDATSRIYTNSVEVIPDFIEKWIGKNRMVKEVGLTPSGFRVPMEAIEINAFIPEGYEIKDQVIGLINQDELEDYVLILDKEGQPRILMILLKKEFGYALDLLTDQALLGPLDGGIWGDPYDNMTLDNHQLKIKFYGGSNYRWSYDYVYDCLYDYQLISVETMSYITLDLEIEKLFYDLVTNVVVKTIEYQENKIETLHKKTTKGDHYLKTFNIYKEINYDYQ